MRPIRETRRARLAQLVAQHGGQVGVASKMGKDKNQVYQWLLHVESKASRNISDSSARALEEAFGLPSGWMDQALTEDSSPQTSPAGLDSSTGHASQPVRLDPRSMAIAAGALTRFLARRDATLDITQEADAELLCSTLFVATRRGALYLLPLPGRTLPRSGDLCIRLVGGGP